jgi:peroxiredoxin
MSVLTNKVPQFKLSRQVTKTDGESVWVDLNRETLFDDKRVVIFGLPGAFTPTCSNQQLPGFEELYSKFRDAGIDDIYCFTVNDGFVTRAWQEQQGIVNVKIIPDGSAEFTIKMNMDVRKDNLSFGIRSWRYAAIVECGEVIQDFVEPGFQDNAEGDPYGVSDPQNVLDNVIAHGWGSVNEDEGKHIELELSDTTDVKEKFS